VTVVGEAAPVDAPRPWRRSRLLSLAIAAGVLLCTAVPAAGAPTSPLLDPSAVVETSRPAPPAPRGMATTPATSTTTPATTATSTTPGTLTTTTPATRSTATPAQPPAPPPLSAELLRTDPGARSAAAQSVTSKRKEARADCTAQRPPINQMLAIGGLVAAGEGSAWGRAALFVAACFAAIGLGAFLIRRRANRTSNAPPAVRGRLETISVVVAIAGTLVGIGDHFVSTPPAPEAAMTVRDVLPRVTRDEYAHRTGIDVSRISKLDRREVGNVVLLEIRLTGYRGKRLALQYATYSLDRYVTGSLLPGTDVKVGLRVADKDSQTSFVPIWVGYPKSERFEAQFRLIENDEIRQLTGTGPMKGSAYRYACNREVRAA
jgi:hypothetical protein